MKGDYGTIKRHMFVIPFEVFALVALIKTVNEQNWVLVGASLFAFVASFLPLILERVFRFRIIPIAQIIYAAFLCSSMTLGEAFNFYRVLNNWDTVLHLLSGFLVGFFVMIVLNQLKKNDKKLRLTPALQAFLIVLIVVKIGALWEIAEFVSDQLFGTHSQGNDLFDTMTDLIYDSVGGYAMGVLWLMKMKKSRVPILSRILDYSAKINQK